MRKLQIRTNRIEGYVEISQRCLDLIFHSRHSGIKKKPISYAAGDKDDSDFFLYGD